MKHGYLYKIVVGIMALSVFFSVPNAAFAADIQQPKGFSSTSNTTSYTTGTFTRNAGDLLVVFVAASGTVDPGSVTDSQSTTYTKITSVVKNASADTIYMFVANSLAPSTVTGFTVTFSCPGDAATGVVVQVMAVTGMSKSGTAAIVQATTSPNQAAGTTPTITFMHAPHYTNVLTAAVANGANPPALTGPTGWSRLGDLGYNTPTSGEDNFDTDGGLTAQTYTWGGSSATAYGIIAAELDTSSGLQREIRLFNGKRIKLVSGYLHLYGR